MKLLRYTILLLVAALLSLSCDGIVSIVIPPPDTDTDTDSDTTNEEQPEIDWESVSYTESTTPLVNPERGFYGGAVDIFKATAPVSLNNAKALRTRGMTLMYIGFYLQSFMNGDISQAYLDMIQKSFDALREAGIKCVLRFAYQNSESSKPWDAPVDVVLRHVEQLKPLLQKNEDVIFILQAGFVGVWGEWYYTTNFIMDPSSDEDYEPRRRLTTALLDALPTSRQIALRTPQFKMRMYNLSVKDTLTAATAHDGSPLSRLAGHNDCFGASQDDWGTFDNETADRIFWKHDSRYFIMGGETCNVSNYCTCKASLKDMKDYHWTYLNSGYNGDVLKRWEQSGCMDEITDRLGYRLVLQEVSYSNNPKEQQGFSLKIKLSNNGFAAPMNPRNAEIVFVADDGTQSRFPLGSDPRTWHPGTHEIETQFKLPAAKGTVYLALEDPLLADNPAYSIALANKDVFDSKTGLNKLFEIK
ncbi:MAG: DUF4832 domain-containing protein [Bacteroidales bacterium]|nr:DUF4832 domain-containing protein [Bacteroidales bacterium]